jgi:hypothetical protein
MSNRLNDDRSAIVIIMQRVHEGDVSGDILARESDYCHLMIPMYFDPLRYPSSADGERTEDQETGEPFRGQRDRMDRPAGSGRGRRHFVTPPAGSIRRRAGMARALQQAMEYELGQYAFAGQYQQSPTPRKGGIFKREYWQYYVVGAAGRVEKDPATQAWRYRGHRPFSQLSRKKLEAVCLFGFHKERSPYRRTISQAQIPFQRLSKRGVQRIEPRRHRQIARLKLNAS